MSLPELPRYLHKAGCESLLVKDAAAYQAAVDDGWTLFPQMNGVAPFDESEPEEPVEAPKKRGRPRKTE